MLIQHDLLHAGKRLFLCLTDQHALPQRQAVRLQHDGIVRLLQIFLSRLRILKGLIGRRGNMILFHQILGKRLASLQDGRVLPGAESPQSRFLQNVHKSLRQRIVRPYDDQIHRFFLCKGCDSVKLLYADRHALGDSGDSRVAGRTVYLFRFRASGCGSRNGVLPSSAPYDQNLHSFLPLIT